MNSHDLARRLLQMPDLPLSTHANNHTANYGTRVALLTRGMYDGVQMHVIIGNFSRRMLNYPNEWVSFCNDKVPDEWGGVAYAGATTIPAERSR